MAAIVRPELAGARIRCRDIRADIPLSYVSEPAIDVNDPNLKFWWREGDGNAPLVGPSLSLTGSVSQINTPWREADGTQHTAEAYGGSACRDNTSADLDPATGEDIIVAALVRTPHSPSGSDAFLGTYKAASTRGWFLYQNGATVGFYLRGDTAIGPAQSIGYREWALVVAVVDRDGNTVLYRNGGASTPAATPAGALGDSGGIGLACYPDNNAICECAIAFAAVWNGTGLADTWTQEYVSDFTATALGYSTRTGLRPTHTRATSATAYQPEVGNLVTDGDMEAVGVASWSAINNATLTKETTTPYEGTQCLRVARNGTNNPAARQDILTVGAVYHLAGWARSDGSADPRIYDGASTLIWDGAVSTSWQRIDQLFTATDTELDLFAITSTGTQYCEFDDVKVEKCNLHYYSSGMPRCGNALGLLAEAARTNKVYNNVPMDGSTTTGWTVDDDGTGNLLTDSDMEAADISAWTAGNSATVTKETADPHGGVRNLKVARNGVNNPSAANTPAPLTIGTTYHVTGWARSDGNAVPQVWIGNSAIWVGTTSTSWQEVNKIHTATSTTFALLVLTSTGTEYAEFDDFLVSAVVGVADDETDVASAGLSELGNNVFYYENSSGGDRYIFNTSTTGNTNAHSLSVYCDNANVDLGFWDASGTSFTKLADCLANYRRTEIANQTPGDTDESLCLMVPDGESVHFALAQMEEATTVSSPIPNTATAANAPRNADAFDTNYTPPQNSGKIQLGIRPYGWGGATCPNSNVLLSNGTYMLVAWPTSGGVYQIYDGTTAVAKTGTLAAGRENDIFFGWGALQILAIDGASASGAYDGSLLNSGDLNIQPALTGAYFNSLKCFRRPGL